MPIFFVTADDIRDRTVTITGPLHRHLRTSLRYRAGDELWVNDEHRCRYHIKLRHVGPESLTADILSTRTAPPRSTPRIILGQAVLKGERMEWVIQKATEFGVAEIVPLVTAQSVVRPRQQRVDSQQARWQRIALEAAQQSERWDVPQVDRPVAAARFFGSRLDATARYIMVEPRAGASGREGLSSVTLPKDPAGTLLFAIGPEGGWREDELDDALTRGFTAVSLGPRILRAETATLAALAVLQSRLGGLG